MNVLLTDVDSVWLRYENLVDIPEKVDGFFGVGLGMPKTVSNVWGFSLHAGMMGFKSNKNSIQFWDTVMKKCGKICDDQVEINLRFGAKILFL